MTETKETKLKKARNLLPSIHPQCVGDTSILFNDHPDYTVQVAYIEQLSDDSPHITTILNADLIKLYDYTVQLFDGDDRFEMFEGRITDINGFEDMADCFTDLYYALARNGRSSVTYIIDIEEYLNGEGAAA